MQPQADTDGCAGDGEGFSGKSLPPESAQGGSPSGGKLVADDFDLSAEFTLLLGEPEDLFLKDLAIDTGLSPHRLTIGSGLGPYRLAVGAGFVADGLNIAAHAGDAGKGERGQGDTHTENGECFLAESGHVGSRHDEQ